MSMSADCAEVRDGEAAKSIATAIARTLPDLLWSATLPLPTTRFRFAGDGVTERER